MMTKTGEYKKWWSERKYEADTYKEHWLVNFVGFAQLFLHITGHVDDVLCVWFWFSRSAAARSRLGLVIV